MKIMNKILSVFALITLVACGTAYEKPVLVDKTPLNIADPLPAEQFDFDWIIITKNNFEEKLKELEGKEQTSKIVLMALTPDNFEKLTISVAELRKYILEQKATILAYKKYYEEKKK